MICSTIVVIVKDLCARLRLHVASHLVPDLLIACIKLFNINITTLGNPHPLRVVTLIKGSAM